MVSEREGDREREREGAEEEEEEEEEGQFLQYSRCLIYLFKFSNKFV